jgi:hypothetical protein
MTHPGVRLLVSQHLEDPHTGWSMGTIGAIAEFVRAPDEPVDRTPDTVVTARGGIRLTLPRDVRAVAYETPAGPNDHWNHAVALCLPAARARRSVRTVVTELGPDAHSLRSEDRDGVLFDLGLGAPTVDVCVRTADPGLLAELRAAQGSSLSAPGSTLAATVVAAGPHRVFRTAFGRVEVYAAIPPPDGRSPDSPHTHLLPHLLRTGRTHAPTVPIPDGYVPSAHCYPPHPTTDRTGRPIPFDQARHQAFQHLLQRFGDSHQARVKAATIEAVRGGRTDRAPAATTPAERAAFAVALRQLAHTDGPSDELTAWRRRHPPGPELLDPEGDPNGG